MNMNTQRVTISLPVYVFTKLKQQVPKRKISSFIGKIVEEKMLSLPTRSIDPVKDFLSLRKEMPSQSEEKIKTAIAHGRT